jgi:NitT/TauT family transport system substrate-binding protein
MGTKLAQLLAGTAAALALAAAWGQAPRPAAAAPTPPKTAAAYPIPRPQPLAHRESVKVALAARFIDFAPLYVTKALGEFDKENLDVEVVTLRGNEATVMLMSSKIDVMASQPSAAFFNAVNSGADIKIVGPGSFPAATARRGYYLSTAWLAGRPYSPQLLKGVEFGSTQGVGSSPTYYLEKELEKGGLSVRDVKFKLLAGGDIMAALESGAIPGGNLSDPYWALVDPKKAVPVALQPADLTMGAWLYGPSLLKDHRDVGAAFMRAVVRTVRTRLQGKYLDDPQVGAILAKEVDQPLEKLRQNDFSAFPADYQYEKGLTDKLQHTYLLTPGVLNYNDVIPESRVVDMSFVP